MNILVTGAAGFIGSHLADKLVAIGHKVVGIDNFDPFYHRSYKDSNISSLVKNANFTLIEGDLEDKSILQQIFSKNKIDVVVHLAAKAGVRPSLLAPIDYLHANINATVNLLEEMRQHHVEKMVFASSSSIYGKCANIPFNEDEKFDHAISIYATSKQSGELFTRMYHNLYNIDTINLRFFTVYGPRQRPDLAIHKFMRSNLEGKEIPFFGDGSMARDYTYVLDTVGGICGAIDRISKNSGIYETYNLGNNTPVTLSALVEAIEETTGKKCQIKRQDVPAGDVPITFANIDRAKKFLNYNPQTDLKKGLNEFYQWLQNHL